MLKIDFRKLWRIFVVFFRIGAFTIGGGYAMLPLIEKEVMDNEKWVSREEILDIFAVSQSIPGVIAINSSMFIGYKVGKLPGAITATLGVISPSFLTILVIAYILINIRDNKYVAKAFLGVRAGVTALIALAAIRLGKAAIKNKLGLVIAMTAFITIVFFDINAIWMILMGAVIGLIAFRSPNQNRTSSEEKQS